MKLWLTQVVVAFILLLGLLAFYEIADVDTNIDTGNTLAIGAFELVLLWLFVACIGAAVTFGIRLVRRRR